MTRTHAPRWLLTATLVLLPLGCGSSSNSGGTGGSGGTSSGGSGGTGGSGGSGGSTGGSGGSPSSGGSGGVDAAAPAADSGASAADAAVTDAAVTDAAAPAGSDGGGASDGATVTVDSGTAAMVANNGCAGGTCLNPQCTPFKTANTDLSAPNIGFDDEEKGYIPPDVIIPTFDDVPDHGYTAADDDFKKFQDGNWTKKMLDWFEEKNLHVDFFINSNNFCDVINDAGCTETVKRMFANHNVGNHTIHHIHMGSKGATGAANAESGCGVAGAKFPTCDAEITGVEEVVKTLSGGTIPHLYRFRAPYGEPFQAGGGAIASIRATVAKYAVHIGWTMESGDADHDDDGLAKGNDFFAKAVTDKVAAGTRGVILMHGTYPWSLGEIKLLLDPASPNSLQQKYKVRLGTVEDAVCWKYGMHSWDIIQKNASK
jgi:peptidoglycan/xylan/chitin deacetylase (PgdA/CDA1 family)